MNSEECFVFSERLIDLEVKVLRRPGFWREVLQIMHEDGGIPKADIMERLLPWIAMRQGKPASRFGRMYIKYGEIMERAIYVNGSGGTLTDCGKCCAQGGGTTARRRSSLCACERAVGHVIRCFFSCPGQTKRENKMKNQVI